MNRQKALYFAFLPWIITECTSKHRKSEGCGMQSAISRTTGGGGIHGDDGNKRNYTVYSMKGLNIFFYLCLINQEISWKPSNGLRKKFESTD